MVVYLFGMTRPVGQLVRGSRSCSWTTDMCIKFEVCLFSHDDDDDVGVVARFKMLLQIILPMSQWTLHKDWTISHEMKILIKSHVLIAVQVWKMPLVLETHNSNSSVTVALLDFALSFLLSERNDWTWFYMYNNQ